ncbi:hypothetical protein K435DRAFT_47685 [Dendrothele bispora CBS 962.96]|uniref:Uncharacterized protein n=1 Tax=Dendrothele bispora (strain CBS 962.96) TaxID=1314807 RepID=A0A4S8KSF3_DENBC|nr:hypothetical protein K435DRAFT_47685 [Dendrothele bispora CBS 962.96]
MYDRFKGQQEQSITHSNNSSQQSPNVDTSSSSPPPPPPPLLLFPFPGSKRLFLISKYSFCANETALSAFKASLSTKLISGRPLYERYPLSVFSRRGDPNSLHHASPYPNNRSLKHQKKLTSANLWISFTFSIILWSSGGPTVLAPVHVVAS